MEALRAGYLVSYITLDDIVGELRQADQLGTLRNKLAHYERPRVLIVDGVGYLGWSTPTRAGSSSSSTAATPAPQ